MKPHSTPRRLPQHRFPVDPWRLVECENDSSTLGTSETLFAVANGYLGMRANPDEGRWSHSHGTFINGFHETWAINHAEDAYGFAKTGQTLVEVPDAKLMALFVDDEPLLVGIADLQHYERVIDFRSGLLTRDLIWRTPSGKRVQVRSSRMVSLANRHLAMLTFEVTMLDSAAPIVVSSELLNRLDGDDEFHAGKTGRSADFDPRRSRKFEHRVLLPTYHSERDGEALIGYRCANSGMTLACGYRHLVDTAAEHRVETTVNSSLARTVITAHGEPGQTIRITKLVSYHSSRSTPAVELAERCRRTLARAEEHGRAALVASQRTWLDDFWENSDVEIHGDDFAQQAIRWNLFQLAQASAQSHEQGIAAKAVTGAGYEGHYFWDTEIFVVPFLAYTCPAAARRLVRFRWHMLAAARQRAVELNQRGVLYPWRTINGEEASAYYAAGTAQYHINAAVALALKRYLDASGDIEFLMNEGAEILVGTARLWEDLGFYAVNGERVFHIHGVTGPDEYTTVVNDNLYTNVMARFNMRYAARVIESLAEWSPENYDRLLERLSLDPAEVDRWTQASDSMFLPFDETLGIHPQDDSFLQREVWDFAHTPPENYPLLLNYHPLVIYRFQVLKQADVVLAMFLRSDQFTLEQKRRNFDYYDPITTGDSSLSACVQAIAAAQVGYDELAVDYFRQALFVDLADTHGNTADGVHIASAGGVWGAVVFGFAGLYDSGISLQFAPRLPPDWVGMSFRMQRHGARLRVDLDAEGCTVSVLSGAGVPIETEDGVVQLDAGSSVRIPRAELMA